MRKLTPTEIAEILTANAPKGNTKKGKAKSNPYIALAINRLKKAGAETSYTDAIPPPEPVGRSDKANPKLNKIFIAMDVDEALANVKGLKERVEAYTPPKEDESLKEPKPLTPQLRYYHKRKRLHEEFAVKTIKNLMGFPDVNGNKPVLNSFERQLKKELKAAEAEGIPIPFIVSYKTFASQDPVILRIKALEAQFRIEDEAQAVLDKISKEDQIKILNSL